MRIVFICDFFVTRGGDSRIGLDLVQLLASQGIPVKVLVGETHNGEVTSGVPVVSLEQKPLLLTSPRISVFRGLFNTTAYGALNRLIDESDTPDTVYIVNAWTKILSPSIFGALNCVARRVLVYAHDYFIACPNGGYFDFGHEEPCDRVPLSISCLGTACDKRSYPQKIWRSGVGAMRRFTWNIGRNGSRIIAVHEGMVEYLTKAGIPERSISIVRNPSKPFTTQLLTECLARERGRILVAKDHTGTPVAAIFYLLDQTSVYYFLTTRRQEAHGGAISLLTWLAIQDAAQRGLIFDFEGIPGEPYFTPNLAAYPRLGTS